MAVFVRIVLSLFLNLTELSWIRNFNLVTRERFFATKFFRAFVSGIRDGYYFHFRVSLQSGQMPITHNFSRSDNPDSQLVIILLTHGKARSRGAPTREIV